MGRSTVALTAAIALAALIACKKSSPSSESAPVPAADTPTEGTPTTAATEKNFSGSWKTAWGPVILTQSGSSVSGSYSGQFKGTLAGSTQGNVASITWTQTNGERGNARFTLSDDGDSFKGTWGSGASSTNGGAWNGTRTR